MGIDAAMDKNGSAEAAAANRRDFGMQMGQMTSEQRLREAISQVDPRLQISAPATYRWLLRLHAEMDETQLTQALAQLERSKRMPAWH